LGACIEKLFVRRQKIKKNPSESEVLKIIMNSGYGKFLQELFGTSETLIHDNTELDKCILNGSLRTMELNNEETTCCMLAKVAKDLRNRDIQHPCKLGTFLLVHQETHE